MNLQEAVNSEKDKTAEVVDANSLETAYGEASKKLVLFVEKNLKVMQSKLLKEKYNDLQKINQAYLEYLPVSFMLNELYQKVRFDERKAHDEYQFFDDQAMDSTKRELNRDDNKKVWFSATELKSAAHTKYESSYARLSAKISLAEGRRSFVERLCKAWDSWQFSLGQISRNLIAEANANGLDLKAQEVLPAEPEDMRPDQYASGILASTL